MSAVLAAATSVVLAALFALAGYAGGTVLLGAAALTVLVVALGWASLLQLPGRRGTSLVVLLTGWAALAVAWLNQNATRPLAAFAAVMAFAVLAAFAHELLRRDGRPRLVESVTGTLSGQVATVLAAGWVLLPGTAAGTSAVVVTAVTVGAARLVTAFPLPQRTAGWACLAGGAVAGSVAAVVLASGNIQACVVAAVAVAAVVAGQDRLLATQAPKRSSLGLLAAAAAPVSSVGMVAYTVIRLLVG
jgi:hypothetical protein